MIEGRILQHPSVIFHRLGPPGGRGELGADPAASSAPFVATLVVSFFDWNSLYPKARHFTGLSNYSDVLTDPDLRHSVWTTILLTAAVVLVSLVLGLALALLLDRRFRGRGRWF